MKNTKRAQRRAATFWKQNNVVTGIFRVATGYDTREEVRHEALVKRVQCETTGRRCEWKTWKQPVIDARHKQEACV
jgi:hypothetical protein